MEMTLVVLGRRPGSAQLWFRWQSDADESHHAFLAPLLGAGIPFRCPGVSLRSTPRLMSSNPPGWCSAQITVHTHEKIEAGINGNKDSKRAQTRTAWHRLHSAFRLRHSLDIRNSSFVIPPFAMVARLVATSYPIQSTRESKSDSLKFCPSALEAAVLRMPGEPA
jgi:hypothetical protein